MEILFRLFENLVSRLRGGLCLLKGMLKLYNTPACFRMLFLSFLTFWHFFFLKPLMIEPNDHGHNTRCACCFSHFAAHQPLREVGAHVKKGGDLYTFLLDHFREHHTRRG